MSAVLRRILFELNHINVNCECEKLTKCPLEHETSVRVYENVYLFIYMHVRAAHTEHGMKDNTGD